jgi:hypothetical protein
MTRPGELDILMIRLASYYRESIVIKPVTCLRNANVVNTNN